MACYVWLTVPMGKKTQDTAGTTCKGSHNNRHRTEQTIVRYVLIK